MRGKTTTIGEWCAEQCGVYVAYQEDSWQITGELGWDGIITQNYPWTIQDPRCLIIVCKKFNIDIIAGDTDKAINEVREWYEIARRWEARDD